MSEEKKDFVVKDRRIFSEDRAEKEEEKGTPKDDGAARAAAEDAGAGKRKAAADGKENDYKLPEINFPTFIFSLNSAALVHLGVIEDPATGKSEKNLPMAKQTIDMLGMIEEKTKGNLTDDEAHMLKNILYELRIIYVRERG